MAVWFIVDPIEKLKLERDTTLFLISLIKDQPVYWIDSLDTDGAHYKRVQVKYDQYDFKTKPHLTFEESVFSKWSEMSGTIFFRLDPPVNDHYRKVATLLATACGHMRVLNSPLALAAISEKLIPVVGQDEIPFKLFGQGEKGQIIKDLWGFGGSSVSKLDTAKPIGASELAQDFDNGVFEGERRLYIMGPHIVGCLVKKPQGSEFRSNLQWGSDIAWEEPTEFELEKTAFYQEWLAKRGVVMATVDFIGKRIIEVNITCPGLIYPSALLSGFAEKGWSSISDSFLELL